MSAAMLLVSIGAVEIGLATFAASCPVLPGIGRLRPGAWSAATRGLVGRYPGVVACVPGVVACFPGVVACFPRVVGTFLDAVRVWEMALATLPTSSGALPGPCRPLPRRSCYVSSR